MFRLGDLGAQKKSTWKWKIWKQNLVEWFEKFVINAIFKHCRLDVDSDTCGIFKLRILN